jgi:hypothetical protein
MRSSCLGSSRCGQQQVSSSIRQASSRQPRCCASLRSLQYVSQLHHTSSNHSCRVPGSSNNSSARRQQRQTLVLVRSSNGSSPAATAASSTPLAAGAAGAAVATADAPGSSDSSSSSEPALHGQESWEEEIEETLKLVCLLPDSGE